MATTSLTTANPAHTSNPARHYYNSAATPILAGSSNNNNNNNTTNTASNSSGSSNNILIMGSPRSSLSCRRDIANIASSGGNITGSCVTTPNHYVPGTYGERALIDIRDTPRPPPPQPPLVASDVIAPAPPVPRRNDVIIGGFGGFGGGRRVGQGQGQGQGQGEGGGGLTYVRRPNNSSNHGHPDDVTPGRENQAYAFDSTPRRLQSPSSNNTTPPQRNALNLFEDGRETICLNDVRVF